VEAIGKVVVGKDLTALGEDPAALTEVTVTEAWRQMQRSGRVQRGPGGGRRGTSGVPDGSRQGNGGASMEAVEERTCGWRGNDSSRG
jgi:hypothetical protein